MITNAKSPREVSLAFTQAQHLDRHTDPSLCVHVQVRAVHLYLHGYGGQRTTLGANSQDLVTLLVDMRCLIGLELMD